ncbi:hypothetical protein Aab01nite_06340 [Paractinoplanes abujensis]|uniref:Uncharacterized protein n=1 Tax=Paractinoplanes abujensis TaxID=882441 RepID=A0A7W7G0E3_9ACTN|nr:hypothetical protein [Actinoplanes abujensis]MBB4691537.1 hypothetical protein [Actinoplanes abujensis]GID17044.1 hypothetical protein Aab01nite_06340 [Actinoplanes abujensis]
MVAASIAWPILALFIDATAWWVETLFLVVAIPLAWRVSARLIYRMNLTSGDLRLRAPLARYRVPLGEWPRSAGTDGDDLI